MEQRNEVEPISAMQKTNKQQKSKIRNKINKERDNKLHDTFGLEDSIT